MLKIVIEGHQIAWGMFQEKSKHQRGIHLVWTVLKLLAKMCQGEGCPQVRFDWCSSWDPFHKQLYKLIIEIYENYICNDFNSNPPIWSQFCTCHDSWAVVAYAKLWLDLMIGFHRRSIYIFQNMFFTLLRYLWMGPWTCLICIPFGQVVFLRNIL